MTNLTIIGNGNMARGIAAIADLMSQDDDGGNSPAVVLFRSRPARAGARVVEFRYVRNTRS